MAKRGRKPISLPEEALSLMGTMPDSHIAQRFGVSRPVARRWREQAGIPAVRPGRPSGEPRRQHKTTTVPMVGVLSKYPGLRERLGTVPDSMLAEEYGLSRERIRQFRLIDEIPSCRGEVVKDLIVRIRPLLADHRDSKIRQITGATWNLIEVVRLQEGIPQPPRVGKYDKSLEKARPLLGTMSDRKLGQMFGVPDTRIFQLRTELGIPPSQELHRYNPIDQDRIQAMFEQGRTDVEIAVELQASAHTIQQIRYQLGLQIKERSQQSTVDHAYVQTQLLQGHNDTEIAAELGCSAGTIAGIRRKMGRINKRSRLPWNEIIPLLGTVPDRVLGARYHTAGATICMKRNSLGIPSFKAQQGSTKKEPA